MKSIDTLVDDIYDLFSPEKGHRWSEENIRDFGNRLGHMIAERMSEERKPPTLRLSNLGWPDRKLWYSVNHPEIGEALEPQAQIKFLYGHILELLLIALAKEAGHDVVGQQDELDFYGVPGHRDGIVDGVLVDVKSASSYSFGKFERGLSREDDGFGYRDQLQAYLKASLGDARLTEQNKGAFLVIDKTLGKITLDVHERENRDWEELVDAKRSMLLKETPPERCYPPEPDGKSGNLKLGVQCSYCQFKHPCWENVRTFLYSSGPRYLVHVERTPDVPEV